MKPNVTTCTQFHNSDDGVTTSDVVPVRRAQAQPFSYRMQEARIRSKKSIVEIATLMKLPPDEISRYERGDAHPTDEVANRILFFLS